MKLHYIKSASTTKPELIDSASSETTVYLRKNIVEVMATSKMSENEFVYYEYLEAKLTKTEYQQYLAELNMLDIERQRADIDYIALMSGIDLDEEEDVI